MHGGDPFRKLFTEELARMMDGKAPREYLWEKWQKQFEQQERHRLQKEREARILEEAQRVSRLAHFEDSEIEEFKEIQVIEEEDEAICYPEVPNEDHPFLEDFDQIEVEESFPMDTCAAMVVEEEIEAFHESEQVECAEVFQEHTFASLPGGVHELSYAVEEVKAETCVYAFGEEVEMVIPYWFYVEKRLQVASFLPKVFKGRWFYITRRVEDSFLILHHFKTRGRVSSNKGGMTRAQLRKLTRNNAWLALFYNPSMWAYFRGLEL